MMTHFYLWPIITWIIITFISHIITSFSPIIA